MKDSRGRASWVARMERCRHFTGLYREVCEAGVNYAELRGANGRLPCILRPETAANPNLVNCPLASYPTEEEAKAHEAKVEQEIRDYFAAIQRDECPICHQSMTREQVGRCVYASPCGHRLYQGTIG